MTIALRLAKLPLHPQVDITSLKIRSAEVKSFVNKKHKFLSVSLGILVLEVCISSMGYHNKIP